MLPQGLKTGTSALVFGNNSSCCWFCAEERMQDNRKDPKKRTGLQHETAAQELKGKFLGKPMFRMPISGGPYFICLDHMKQFVERLEELGAKK